MKTFNDSLEVGDEFFHNGRMWVVFAPGRYALILDEDDMEQYAEKVTLQ